jgi:hypothetical protein
VTTTATPPPDTPTTYTTKASRLRDDRRAWRRRALLCMPRQVVQCGKERGSPGVPHRPPCNCKVKVSPPEKSFREFRGIWLRGARERRQFKVAIEALAEQVLNGERCACMRRLSPRAQKTQEEFRDLVFARIIITAAPLYPRSFRIPSYVRARRLPTSTYTYYI